MAIHEVNPAYGRISERRYRYPERSGISTRADFSRCLNCRAFILFSLICLRLSFPSIKFGRETSVVGRGGNFGSAVPIHTSSKSEGGLKEGEDVQKRFANGSVYGGQSSTIAIAVSRRNRAEPLGWQACPKIGEKNITVSISGTHLHNKVEDLRITRMRLEDVLHNMWNLFGGYKNGIRTIRDIFAPR
jgi:hypothetical protein